MLGVGEAFVTDEESAADPIQRVVASAAMAERFLLHAATGVVDGLVREADRVEVINDDRRVESIGESCRVAAERVDDRHVDRVDPFGRSVVEPVANDLARTSLGDVEELVTVQVDESGDHDRWMLRAGPQEAGLVQAQRAGRTQAFGIIDKVFAVLAHRSHRGMPSDTELACDLSDAVSVLTDPAADLDPSAACQRRARSELGVVFGPRSRRAQRLDASPDPLRPHQPHRPARDRQIPHLHAAATMTDRPHPTRRAAHPIGRRLNQQPPLAILEHVRADHEARHVEQRGRAFTTVINHQGSPSLAAFDSRKSGEAPGLVGGPTNRARSRHDPSVLSASSTRTHSAAAFRRAAFIVVQSTRSHRVGTSGGLSTPCSSEARIALATSGSGVGRGLLAVHARVQAVRRRAGRGGYRPRQRCRDR